jgi:SNF2 family DNA or RNA helicase
MDGDLFYNGLTCLNAQEAAPVKVTLYRHQAEAFLMTMDLFSVFSGGLQKSEGMAYLMEMGTGKTVTAIASMGCMYEEGLVRRVLIVAPLSILPVWEDEIRKYAAFQNTVTILTGNMDHKRMQLKHLSRNGLQIVIVNYESMRKLVAELKHYDADMIIADEGHRLKDRRTAQSEAMHELGDRARYKLLLTGTPVTNHEIDIWSEYRFLDPHVFGLSFYEFRSMYFVMGGYGYHTPIFLKSELPEYTERLHSIAYRCRKEDCLDLPEITETIRRVDLEPEARKLYDLVREDAYAGLSKARISAPNVLTRLLRLSQITGGYVTDDDGIIQTVSRAKLAALEDIVDAATAEGQKLVVMAHFTPELDAIEGMLKRKKICYSVLRGSTQNRGKEVARFQNDPKCTVFVGQIQAAGEGISLTAASTMIFYSVDYSMVHFEQAKARIHRSGQTKPCSYIYLCCRNTVDQRVLKALREKKDLAQMLIDDYREGNDPFAGGR